MSRDDDSRGTPYQIGFCSILFFIFLTLKLTGHVEWSWWIVTLPLWGTLALGLALFGVAFCALCVANAVNRRRNRRARAERAARSGAS